MVLPCKGGRNGIAGGGAAAVPYLHVELGPRGGVLHHSVHHTDQSLALTHLQQTRKEISDISRDVASLLVQAPMFRAQYGTAVGLGQEVFEAPSALS